MNNLAPLAAAGCRFVRLARREKRPLGAGWQHRSTDNLEDVAAWLKAGLNVGLLLGPASGVVDVEYDTPEGRDQLAAFGVLDIPTPTWRSARGEHRLFRWEPWMPEAAAVKADAIEIRPNRCYRRPATRRAWSTNGQPRRGPRPSLRSRPSSCSGRGDHATHTPSLDPGRRGPGARQVWSRAWDR